jgi:cytosine/adenosine deaminase-related metal-dependent hydrolase
MEPLARHGVRVGLGQDGIRDYWSPYGDGDMLGRTWQLSFVNGFRRDDLIERCVALATLGGRAVITGDVPSPGWAADQNTSRGLGVGDPADLVLVAAETVAAAVMDRPSDRVVIHEGRVVAKNGALV